MRATLPNLYFDNEQDVESKALFNEKALEYLRKNNDHRYADKGMFLKLGILIGFCLFFYLCLFFQHSLALFFLCYFLFMMFALLLAINVVHDASHNVFFKSKKANAWLNYIVTIPLGIDPDCWRVRHVVQHHSFTNIEYYDLDIDYNGILRQTPFQVHHFFMRYQHLYWPLVAGMTFPTIVWLFDLQDRLGLKFNKSKFTYPGARGWIFFLIGKTAHLFFAFGLPLLLCAQFNFFAIILIYFLSQCLASFIFVILILGSHWAKATFYQAPHDQKIPHSTTKHVFNTSLNWRLKSTYLEYWLGGLNLHLTHHIYPGFSHRHYHKLTPILAEIAMKQGIPYHEINLKELFRQQQIFLKKMGRN